MAGFTAKHQAEQDALQMARNLARDMGLPMSIEDTEWQFDKNKLTIFYSADGRVDFRDFVKKMGSHNKTFLWMERSDGKAPPNVPAMSSNQGIGGHGGMLSMGGIGSMGMMGTKVGCGTCPACRPKKPGDRSETPQCLEWCSEYTCNQPAECGACRACAPNPPPPPNSL